VRRDSRCRFDHLFLSRNEGEIARRVDILVKALEKESASLQKFRRGTEKKEGDEEEEAKNFNFDEIMVRSDNEESHPFFLKKFKNLSDDEEMEELISSKSPSIKKTKKEMIRKQSDSAKNEEEDEEEKFKHLKAESELRIGGGYIRP